MRNRSMKRFAGAATSVALVLAACGGSDDSDADAPTDEPAETADAPVDDAPVESAAADGETVEITMSHWALEAPPFSNLLGIIDDFNASQDGVQVETVNVPFESYSNTMFTQMGAGEGATLVSLEDYDLGKAVEAGLAVDLTGKITPPESGLAGWNDQMVIDGVQYAAGLNTHAYQLFVNPALMEELGAEVPTTYEEFLQVAELATDGADSFGFGFRSTPGELSGWYLDTTNWLIGAGGNWSDADGNPTVDSPEVAEAIARMQTFIDKGLIPEGADAATYRRAFGEGKIPMVLEAMVIGSILEANYPVLEGNMEMYPAPFGQDDFLANPTGLVLNSNASDEEQAAAITFVNYLMQDDVQTKMQDQMGGVLVAAELPFSDAALAEWPWLSGWQPTGNARSSIPVGYETNYAQFREAVLSNVEEIFAGKVSIEEGLAAAQAQAEELK